ncbi:MAG: hypothetical protein DMG49_10470 [Acidobacteria bacterium]|nr:MAG: hypothetical protein DMG49_10470 [Acidobacteriota bacterium]
MIWLCFRVCIVVAVMASTPGAFLRTNYIGGDSGGQAADQPLAIVGYAPGWVKSAADLAVAENGPCTEQLVKVQSVKEGAGVNSLADDMYFFSGALERPVVGKAAIDNAAGRIATERENENYAPLNPDRIVAAPSGDMAYEYGTTNIRFDERKSAKHFDFTAAYLRVWKAVDGSCKVAAEMFQPQGQR